MEGLKVVISAVWVSALRVCLDPVRIGLFLAMDQVTSMKENLKDIEGSACLADHFTANSIVACAFIRSRENGDSPCTAKPASIDSIIYSNSSKEEHYQDQLGPNDQFTDRSSLKPFSYFTN